MRHGDTVTDGSATSGAPAVGRQMDNQDLTPAAVRSLHLLVHVETYFDSSQGVAVASIMTLAESPTL